MKGAQRLLLFIEFQCREGWRGLVVFLSPSSFPSPFCPQAPVLTGVRKPSGRLCHPRPRSVLRQLHGVPPWVSFVLSFFPLKPENRNRRVQAGLGG